MGYKEIKSEIRDVASETDSLRYKLVTINNDLKEKKSNVNKLQDDKAERIKTERNRKLVEFEKGIVEPYNLRIAKLEDNKVKLKEKRDSLLGKVSCDTYKMKDKYRNKLNINSELETCKELDEILQNYYGSDFQKVLDVIIEEDDDDESESYQDIIKNVRVLKKENNSNFDLTEFLNSLMDNLGLEGSNEPGQINEQVPICLAIGIVFVLALIFLYPFMIILFIAPLVYNLLKSHYYIKAKSYCKALTDRKDEIEKIVDKEIERAVKRDRDKINTEYETVNKKIEIKIKNLEHESELDLENQRPNFVFKTTDIDNEFIARETSLKNKISDLEKDAKKIDESIKDNSIRLDKLRVELNKSLKDIVSDYLGGTEECYKDVLPSDYLFDVVDGEPKFFKLPKDSAIFFYEDEDSLNKFIDLIYYQTVGRVKPTQIKFYYLDYKYMGDKFISSSDLECVVIGDKETSDKLLDNICNQIRKRMPIINHFNSIDDYNDFMRGQDCVGEQYVYVFNVYSDLNNLINDSNRNICNVGPKYGIYNYYFVNYNEINESNYSVLCEILDLVKKYYRISNNAIRKGCKEYYLSKLEALKEQN